MIWVSVRQFRAQAWTGATVLAVFAAAMLLLGERMRHSGEVERYQSLVYAMDAVLLLRWAAAPLDRMNQDRFGTLLFGTRGVVPPTSFAI